MTSASFPLGVPTNRELPGTPPKLVPIDGRPNWFRDTKGHEIYREPPKPQPPVEPSMGRELS